jgi:chromatin remodeling complex protein RSC6
MPRAMPASFNKPFRPDAVLAALVGPESRPRSEFVKRVWAVIKSQSLQDVKLRRTIVARTPEFRAFVGADTCTMFDIPRLIGAHLVREG